MYNEIPEITCHKMHFRQFYDMKNTLRKSRATDSALSVMELIDHGISFFNKTVFWENMERDMIFRLVNNESIAYYDFKEFHDELTMISSKIRMKFDLNEISSKEILRILLESLDVLQKFGIKESQLNAISRSTIIELVPRIDSQIVLYFYLGYLGVEMSKKFEVALSLIVSMIGQMDKPSRAHKLTISSLNGAIKTIMSIFDSTEELCQWIEYMTEYDSYRSVYSLVGDQNRGQFPLPIELIYTKKIQVAFSKNLLTLDTSGVEIDDRLKPVFAAISAVGNTSGEITVMEWTTDNISNVGLLPTIVWYHSGWSGKATKTWIDGDFSLERANQAYDKFGATNPEEYHIMINSAQSWQDAWSE